MASLHSLPRAPLAATPPPSPDQGDDLAPPHVHNHGRSPSWPRIGFFILLSARTRALKQLTETLRPLWTASEDPGLAVEGVGELFNWIRDERERLTEEPQREVNHLTMTTLENGHRHVEPVSYVRLARMERRIAEIATTSEQRVAILRDAIADFVAGELRERDDEIQKLKEYIADLERQLQQKTAVDQLVNEATARLDARQVARDDAKRGKTGCQGERGARGEQGRQGPRGPAGKPAEAPTIHSWYIDTAKYRAVPFFADGKSGPELNLRPLFEAYHREVNS